MHIAIVRRFCSLKKAGAERYCVNLFRGLQRLGHKVTVVGEGIDEELRSEVDFLPVPVLKLNSWTKNRSFAFNAAKVVRSHPFDIVHGLSRVEGLDTYRLTDPMQTHWVKVWYRHPVSRWLQHLNPRHLAVFDLERRLFQPGGVRRVIVQSRLDARLLREYFGVDESRICHIVNGVDTTVFNPTARLEAACIRDELDRKFASISISALSGRASVFDSTATATETRWVAGWVAGAGASSRSPGGQPEGLPGLERLREAPESHAPAGLNDSESVSSKSDTSPATSFPWPGIATSAVPLIVFASMDFRRKGLDSLLAALARLKDREARLLVLGDGDITNYERKAQSLAVRHRVLFAGRQSAIHRFYGAADLFVLPTVYEPFPNVNLEAMACGTPVITTATAGGADIISEGTNGYLIPDAWSVDALAERIDFHLALSTAEKQRMADACWQTASKLRVADNAQKVATMFADVVREKNAA